MGSEVHFFGGRGIVLGRGAKIGERGIGKRLVVVIFRVPIGLFHKVVCGRCGRIDEQKTIRRIPVISINFLQFLKGFKFRIILTDQTLFHKMIS